MQPDQSLGMDVQPDQLDPMAQSEQPMVEVPPPEINEPDLAVTVYQSLGLESPGVSVKGYRSPVADLRPGDLVGWKGGEEADGRYVGNIAVYAGEGQIIEKAFGHNRRRKLGPNENTFGIPVNLPGDEPTEDRMDYIEAVD